MRIWTTQSQKCFTGKIIIIKETIIKLNNGKRMVREKCDLLIAVFVSFNQSEFILYKTITILKI